MITQDCTTIKAIRQRYASVQQRIAAQAAGAIGTGMKEWEAERLVRRLGLEATHNANRLREAVSDLIAARYDAAPAIDGHLCQRLSDSIAAGAIKDSAPHVGQYWLDVLAQVEDGTLLESIAADADYQARLELYQTVERAVALVRAACGDAADARLDEICERLDDPAVPDTVAGTLKFWQDVIAELTPNPQSPIPNIQPPTIYDLARQAVETRAAQFPADDVTVWRGRGLTIYISRYQDLLTMTAINGDPRQAQRIRVGQLLGQGWTFTLDRASYERWAAKAKRLAH